MLTTDAVPPVERYNRYQTFHRLSTLRTEPERNRRDESDDPGRPERDRNPDRSRSAAGAPADAKTAARRLAAVFAELFRLQAALAKLSAASSLSVWHAREAECEPPGAVRVRVSRGATAAEYRIRVVRSAEAQIHVSRPIRASAKIGPELAGVHEIELRMNNGVYRRTIVAFPTDSIIQIFVKITSALHDTRSRMRCRIRRDADGTGAETARLVVQASDTGETGAFALRDVKGDLLARLGLDRPSVLPQDAECVVDDGMPLRTCANRIDLDDRKVAVEWDPSEHRPAFEAVVRIRPARADVVRQLEASVAAHNRFREAAAAHLPALLAEYDRIFGLDRDAPEWGIVPDDDGRLRFDAARFLETWRAAGYSPPEAVAGPQGWASRAYSALAELVGRAPDLLSEIVGMPHRALPLYGRDGRRVAAAFAPGLLFDYSSASPLRNA